MLEHSLLLVTNTDIVHSMARDLNVLAEIIGTNCTAALAFDDRAARHVDVLCVTPFSGVPDYTRAGLAVGLRMRREKAEIFINIAAARAAGCDYQAQLLAMATIVQ